jgi:hypothetical protein
MKPLSLAFAALVISLTATAPARADFSIIRWPSGDCTIWDNFGLFATPGGYGWERVVVGIPTWNAARVVLDGMYQQGMCR